VTDSLSTESRVLDDAGRRKLAADLYNGTWTFLEMADRTPAQTDEMIHMAHASRFHWGEVVASGGGQPANLARGEWLCSRVYAVVGRAEPSLWHAHRCLELLDGAQDAEDWDIAAAYEALARASALAGDDAASKDWLAKGLEAAAAISDPEDRAPIEADLAGLG